MHPSLRETADRQLGVFTAADALAAGYQHGEIRHLKARGEWVTLRRGIYSTAADLERRADPRLTHAVQCLAVLRAVGRAGAVVSHGSAARLHRLPVPREHLDVVRLTDPGRSLRGRGYSVTQSDLLTGEVVRLGPLRVTTAARTLADCSCEWALDDAVVAMDAAVIDGEATVSDLRDAVGRLARRVGAPRAARAVGLVVGRADSPLETRGRLRIVGSGLPVPELQVEISRGGRAIAEVDAWYEEAAVALEFDGKVKYTDPWRGRTPAEVLWEEKRREDEMRALGIRVVRIVSAEVSPRGWPPVARGIARLIATPGPAMRSFDASPVPAARLRERRRAARQRMVVARTGVAAPAPP